MIAKMEDHKVFIGFDIGEFDPDVVESLTLLDITSKSKATDEDIEKFSNEVKENWWQQNKEILPFAFFAAKINRCKDKQILEKKIFLRYNFPVMLEDYEKISAKRRVKNERSCTGKNTKARKQGQTTPAGPGMVMSPGY